MKDDSDLIHQVLVGDKKAFDNLTLKYYPACLKKASALVKDEDLAKYLVQSAFIHAYFCISNLKDTTRFRFWLLGIVKNVVKNYLRKTQRNFLSLENYYQYLKNQDENKDIQRITEIVMENLNSLPEAYRVILHLFYYENMEVKQIAQDCKLSVETVKVRLHRGRKMLKEAFKKYSEMYQYYQTLKNKATMKIVIIADIIMGGANKEHCSILLQDEEGSKAFQIIIGTGEAMIIVMALRNIIPPRPFVFNLTASMMEANNLKMDSVYIHDLVEGVFISTLKLRNGNKLQEYDTRPSDAITFALMFDSPIYVSEKILDQVGFPIPEKYKHSHPKEKGIGILVDTIEEWKKDMQVFVTKAKARPKTEQEIQQAIDKLIEFTFAEGKIEKKT